MSKPKSEKRLVEVSLAKAHTHAGRTYQAGAKIKVDEFTQRWLVQNQVVAGPANAAEGK